MTPPSPKKDFFGSKKNLKNFFSGSSSQNMTFDTKTNILTFVDPKLWPKMPKNGQKWPN